MIQTTFKLSLNFHLTQGTFKLIRLRMKGKNFYGDNHLFITGIEFFGSYI